MQKRIAVINDLSCFGRCAISISMPILSASGLEVCTLPTAVLSSHFAFPNPVYIDTTEHFENIKNHWNSLNLKFDAIFTGFIGSLDMIKMVSLFIDMFKGDNTKVIVDPTMADNGKFYSSPIFTAEYLEEMKELCKKADIIMPNITEACLLVGKEYIQGPYKIEYIESLLKNFEQTVILTGVYFNDNEIGCTLKEFSKKPEYIFSSKINGHYFGTGDIFGSTFVGAILKGFSYKDATKIAADFVSICIEKSNKVNTDNVRGINFEQNLGKLIEMLK
ncbi:MAG: pyridoxamine kinase [Defluviitaleaceae bacterium]|nr:pyridoxamine kinase [Defluviitaleaceae bacterium]